MSSTSLQESDTNDGSHDLAVRRRQRLATLVESRGVARLDELSAALGVSQATVRRDLNALATQGRVRRVHGGVVAVDQRLDEPHFDVKAAANAEAKARIAERAIGLLDATDTVYLDSGSTVLALARLLHGWTKLAVVTNSLPVANELVGRGPHLIVLGGELRSESRALVGPLTRLMLEELRVDRAVMGTFALDLVDGLSTTDPGEAFTKRMVMRRAREVILLADRTKLGTHSFVDAGALEDVDILVTDQQPDEAAARALERAGVQVVSP
jgi:DeoR/GlpR family transcriptional regulator of sugar metabolism